jgi:hypothetical protein
VNVGDADWDCEGYEMEDERENEKEQSIIFYVKIENVVNDPGTARSFNCNVSFHSPKN